MSKDLYNIKALENDLKEFRSNTASSRKIPQEYGNE